MITVNTAESALRNIYLETVINEINNRTNPFLTMISQNTKTIAENTARVDIRYGNEGNVKAGTEDGALPKFNAKHASVEVPLKNLYGTFHITDKALKAAQNTPGAHTALLGGEMKNLVSVAQANLNRMVYGNGEPVLAHTVSLTAGSFGVEVRDAGKFSSGMRLRLKRSDGASVGGILTVTSINGAQVGFSPSITIPRADRLYIYAEDSEGLELNGIDSIFGQDRLYNLDRSAHPEILPFSKWVDGEGAGKSRVISEADISDFLYELEEYAKTMPTDIMLTHPTVLKALFEEAKHNRIAIEAAEFEGGFKGFKFNGIPVYGDVRCMPGVVYALDSSSWVMHQLNEWEWLEGEESKILSQIPGTATYSATLVKYADLVCERPFTQGKLSGFTGARWR